MKKIMFDDRYGLTEAVLSGRKTQTRRICNIRLTDIETGEETVPSDIAFLGGEWRYTIPEWGKFYQPLPKANHPRYKVGEIVAVAQCYNDFYNDECDPRQFSSGAGWTNKMFVRSDLMPNRIRITNVRVERLQDISDADCIKEGICKWTKDRELFKYDLYEGAEMFLWSEKPMKPREAYAALIDRIAGKGVWNSNPYVFVYDFELVK